MGDLIPIGAATALFGAPLMLVLLARMHRATRLPAGSADNARQRPTAEAVLRRRFIGIALLTVVAFALALDVGHGPQGWHFSSLDEFSRVAIWRAPRAVAALAAGAMLAVAGTLMQRMTGNSLASPEVLGVSAGAALGLIAVVVAVGDAGHGARIAASARAPCCNGSPARPTRSRRPMQR